jgi:hypothetical protein
MEITNRSGVNKKREYGRSVCLSVRPVRAHLWLWVWVPVIVLLEEVVKFLRGFEQYGYVVRARDEEHKSNNNRGDTDCELSMGMERGRIQGRWWADDKD